MGKPQTIILIIIPILPRKSITIKNVAFQKVSQFSILFTGIKSPILNYKAVLLIDSQYQLLGSYYLLFGLILGRNNP